MKNSRSRREFLRLSAAGALGALALSQYSCRNSPGTAGKASAAKSDPKSFGIGLQLYTIRDAMATDVRGSLKQVSDA